MITIEEIVNSVSGLSGRNEVLVSSPTNQISVTNSQSNVTINGQNMGVTVLDIPTNISVSGITQTLIIENTQSGGGSGGSSYFPSGW